MAINRDRKPIASEQISFSPPKFKRQKLNNGAEIYLIKKTDLPLIRINLLINSGSTFDPKEKYGISNLTSMCIDEGAGEYDALQLADEFEFLGARFGVHSDADLTLLSMQVLTENFDEALNLFSSVILSPHFKENDFLREKRKAQTRIEQFKDEPDYIANTAFEFFLFGNENPYAFPVIGIESSLNDINISDIRKFYGDYFNPVNASIIAAGNFDDENMIAKFEGAFQNWHPSVNSPNKFPSVPYEKSKIYIVHKQDSVQTEIRIGHLTSKRNDKDYFQKQLLNLILGGQFTSRLNLNLREKHGFTYGIHSRFSYYKNAAYFAVSTSVNADNTADALSEIFNELIKIREGVTEDELNFAKSSITKRFPLNFETYSQIASNFGNKVVHNLPDDYFEKFIDNILNMSINDVNTAASESIVSERVITVLVGDEKKISAQFEGKNFGELIKINYDEIFAG
jgi:zinc protease